LRVALVSRNPGKLRELRALFPVWKIESLATAGIGEETGPTFYANARRKALFGRRTAPPEAWVLGEDSGLEVHGLGGAPGIRSARYAGPAASDTENLEKLLEALAGMTGGARRACYVCELVLLSPSGEEFRGRGTLAGRIGTRARGSGGFGYDPAFVPLHATRTVAELGDEWKRSHSHRAAAARMLRRACSGGREPEEVC
jgi:XTP/dITP diphosphohydrolase